MIGGGISALAVVGVLGFVVYVGMVGPETSVYAGARVPARFVRVMKEVGALDQNEKVVYFYSDALTDIRESFCFVSDKKVAVYSDEAETPLIAIPFDLIDELDLARENSFFVDSQIFLSLSDGTPIAFPVSNEGGGDKRFFDAIVEGVDKVDNERVELQ